MARNQATTTIVCTESAYFDASISRRAKAIAYIGLLDIQDIYGSAIENAIDVGERLAHVDEFELCPKTIFLIPCVEKGLQGKNLIILASA